MLAIDLNAELQAKLVTRAMEQIQKAWDDSAPWRAEREMDYAYEHGLVGKQNKNLPFEGAPDISRRTSMLYKRQWIGDFIAPVVDVPHIVKISGGGKRAQTMQEFYDTMFKVSVRNFPRLVRAAASRYLGAAGNCIIKVSYDYTTQKSTKAETVPEDLRLMLKLLEQQESVLSTHAKITGAMMGAPAQPEVATSPDAPSDSEQPAESDTEQPAEGESGPAAAEQPESAISGQLEQLRAQPLQLVAARYRYDLDNPEQRALAEDVLRQIRAGEDVVTAIIERALCPLKLSVIDHWSDLILPGDCADIQESPWVGQLLIYETHDLRAEEACGKFKNVEELISSSDSIGAELAASEEGKLPSEAEQSRQYRKLVQGMSQNVSLEGRHPVFEFHLWMERSEIERFNGKVDSDDHSMVRAVMNFSPYGDRKKSVLRIMEHPNDFEGMFNWPFVQGRCNDMGEGVLCGEGIPKMNRPFEIEEIESDSGALARDLMAAAPLTVWNENLMWGDVSTPEERRMPGHNMSIQGNPENLLKVYTMPDLSSQMHAWASRNRQLGREFIGIADTSGLPNYDRPPTSGQIATIAGPANSIKAAEIKNWLSMWSDVYLMSHLVLKQYFFQGTGANESRFTKESTGEEFVVTPQDFAPNYIIRAGGDPGMVDEQQVINKIMLWIQLIGDNPKFAPFSFPAEWVPDVTALLLGASRTQKWSPPPQDRERYQQMFMQMQAQLMEARQANQQKRNGASTQVKQAPGANAGNVGIGVSR